MALAATSSTLYVAQRKRLRGKRLLARAWFLGKCFPWLSPAVWG